QRVRHAERDTRFHRLHAVVEVVDIYRQELALVDRRQRLLGIAREVAHDAHHERNLDLLLSAVQLDVVLDLHARSAVATDELLTALLRHCAPPIRKSMLRVGAVCHSSSRIPPTRFAWSSPSGATSFRTSRKSFATSRFARSTKIGTGLDGSFLRKKAETASNARIASSRDLMLPTPITAPAGSPAAPSP